MKGICAALCLLCLGCLLPPEKPVLPDVEDYIPEVVKSTEPESLPRTLSLDDCITIALAENPLAQAAAAGVSSAREAAGETASLYYPEISVHASGSRWQRRFFLPSGLDVPGAALSPVIGPTDDWLYNLRARYTLFDSGGRAARLRQALSAAGAARADADSVRQDIVLNVSQAYYGYIAAEAVLTVARENLARSEDHLRLVRERFQAGAAAQTDVLRTQVEASNAKLQLVRAEDVARIARGNVNVAMGLPVELSLALDMREKTPLKPGDDDLREAFDSAVHERPEITRALERVSGARSAVEQAESLFGPRLTAEAQYGRHDDRLMPQENEWLALLALEQPLFSGFSTIHAISRSKADLAREEAKTKQLVLAVRQEVWNSYSRLQEAFQAVAAAQTLVHDAQESMRSIKERYAAGGSTISDLLDAQTALAHAEANYAEAIWNFHAADAVWDRARGAAVPPGASTQ